MANFKARFDLEERISKKLKTITKNIEQLRKSRDQLNKPTVLKVRDEATKKVAKVNKELEKVHRSLRRPYTFVLLARDRAMPVLQRISSYARNALSRGYSFVVRAIDLATATVGRIASFVRTAIPKYRDFTIRAIDGATRIIGTVRRAIMSIPTMVTVTLGFMGMGSFLRSTVGSSMRFEEYGVAMRHWLRGNEQMAQELMQWMGRKADLTPFTSADIFPALTGAVALAGPEPKEIKRLTSLAIDMAALTPGASVEDAMRAIQNARMGELTMMKRFGFNITKRQLDEMGWEKFLREVEKEFTGGADALSRTLKGQINTLTGYASSLFRSMGDGISGALKPRIDAIVSWLMSNEETWSSWKKSVEQMGAEAGEFVFSRFEKGFEYIRKNYLANPEFQELDIEGKIRFIADDLRRWWDEKGRPIVVRMGVSAGKLLFEGIMLGFREGMRAIGESWKEFLSEPSWKSISDALIGTAIFGSFATFVLNPLVKALDLLSKVAGKMGQVGKGLWDWGTKSRGRGHGGGKPPIDPSATLPSRSERLQRERAERRSGRMSRVLRGVGRIANKVPVLGAGLGVLSILRAEKGERAGIVGGIGGGMAGASVGAAIGSIIPGIGTAIGGMLGGVLGSIGGTKIAEWFSENWMSVRDTISETLFNGEWWRTQWHKVQDWAKEKLRDTKEWWEGIKQTASETLFSAEWWFEKVGFIYGYLESTLFSAEWWYSKWENVKSWTLEKWATVVEVWESVKGRISETLFNPEWWGMHWENVKNWTRERWETAVEIWESVKTRIDETIFNSEWWYAKWEAVRGWTREKWDSAKEIWNSVRETIGSTLFNSEWWLGKWGQVVSWGKQKLNELKTWASDLWGSVSQSFQRGRERGQQAARYAEGGIITRPHLGLVGEEGAEAIIPLSSDKRSRALKLYEQVGRMLGVRQYAYGGVVGASVLPQEQVTNVISIGRSRGRNTSAQRDIININFNGDNHFYNNMDAEKVAKIAVEAFKEVLETESFEGGEIVINV